MSLVSMTASVEPAEVAPAPSSASVARAGSGRLLRPALGLLLPVAVAVSWELAVRQGSPAAVWCRRRRSFSRPSPISPAPASSAPCRRDAVAGGRRVRLRRGRGHPARRHHRLFGADAPAGRSDPAGAARDPLDRLGAAVHSLVRHLRGLEDHPDRGRRVLSGLSRRHGRGDVGRPQDRRGRPRLPAVRARHGAPHPAAGGVAGLCHLAARGLGLGWMFVVAAEFMGASTASAIC